LIARAPGPALHTRPCGTGLLALNHRDQARLATF